MSTLHDESTSQSITELRRLRLASEITSRAVAARAGVSTGRLSELERGVVEATGGELARISRALHELILAQAAVKQVANEVGWPL